MNEYFNRIIDTRQNFGFKRNKRDIEKEILYNKEIYIFKSVLNFSYNKALIYQSKENENKLILMSYKTIVCEIIEKEKAIYFDYFSKTTGEHIKTFLFKYGFIPYNGITKKELEKGGVLYYEN